MQLQQIPPRPSEYDGVICLFELAEGVHEAAIRTALVEGELASSDEIESVSLQLGEWPPATIRLRTHEAARRVRRGAKELAHVAGGVDTAYNERSYDGRIGEEGRDDDDGRGL